jgi:hypothetical protein
LRSSFIKAVEINHEAHEGHEEFVDLDGRDAAQRAPNRNGGGQRRQLFLGSFVSPPDCGLDFCTAFHLYRIVPAVANGAPRSATGQSTQSGAVAFATTHWSVVLAAQGESAEAEAALEKLCRTYWWPLYGFVRREGYKPEEAQDLTQAFFARLLERRDLETVRQERGRLRSYLLA